MADMDVVIIGGGVGGYVAALKGAQLGLKIALIEKDKIGGICLNHGCIPTKSLASSAQIWEHFKNAKKFGLSAENISFDFARIIERKDKIVNRLTMGVKYLLKARAVQLIEGEAEILSPKQVVVYQRNNDKEDFKTKNIIIATGSTVRQINIEGLENKNIIDTNEVLTLKNLPKKMLIIGAGYSGVEFASIFNSFGVEVSVKDLLKRILLPVDDEIANSLLGILKKQGISFFLNSKLEKIVSKSDGLLVNIKSKEEEKKEIIVEKVLLSTGRVPDFGGLNIQGLGIELENEGIKVDQYMKTNIPGIYAVGDVVAKKMLAHVATAQGQVAVQHIAGIKNSKPMSYQVVPFCVFTNPEVASVGYNEGEAREEFSEIKIFRFPYQANGKALGMDEKEGYVKMIANAKDNQVVGVHIIGAHASDLIAEATLAIQKRCTASDIAETIHAHPTLPETIAETAEGILGQPIHVLK